MSPVLLPWMRLARRLLGEPLDRLRDYLAGLGHRLRELLAETAGEVVAAILRALLEDIRLSPGPARTQTSRDWEAPCWPDEEDESRGDQPEECSRPELVHVSVGEARRWGPLLTAGLQALAWWLLLPRCTLPARAALSAGLAGGLALAAGVPLAPLAVLTGSALGLVALADAAGQSVDVLAQAAGRQ